MTQIQNSQYDNLSYLILYLLLLSTCTFKIDVKFIIYLFIKNSVKIIFIYAYNYLLIRGIPMTIQLKLLIQRYLFCKAIPNINKSRVMKNYI